MKIHTHPLLATSPGTRREVTSLHFGTPGNGPKAFIQASLHADEVPPMLVSQHLRGALGGLEQSGRLRGEIVLIPVANPIGLGQRMLEQPVGRFELASGENFNRHYADLFEIVRHQLDDRLGADEHANISTIRALLREACARLVVHTELQSLRQVLLSLAVDADTVLDLHCDNEALLHLYTTPASWHEVESLARSLQCPLTLLADGSGDNPFDEACSLTWQRLAAHLAATRPGIAAGPGLAQACVAATVELRGETDVSHVQAASDARGLLRYLMQRGHIEPDADFGEWPAAPSGAVRPLAGSMPVAAPIAGVLLYLRELGTMLAEGEPFAEIIDPVSGQTVTVTSPVNGLFFARDARRYAAAGARIAKISGTQALRHGKLMSA